MALPPPTNNASSQANQPKIYTDSELHDLFVKITTNLMDNGKISVDDSKFTKELRNFLNSGESVHSGGRSNSHNNDDDSHRHDTRRKRVNPTRLRINLEHIKGLDEKLVDQLVLAVEDNGYTINQLLDELDKAQIQLPKGMGGKIARAIMDSSGL